ncbi:ATP-binding protein [Actinomyces weissii]|uniref:Putative DNA binding domain-containing protein n=1 Tax=Actinomyces weissii TaxID=675090 RepID=A0A7T7S1M1_9ACTO|nr:ATP-binding protein [Actinomyces weissii]QQM67066.1 putative DNA binding domain-containing protein [Actinomyces weissii]
MHNTVRSALKAIAAGATADSQEHQHLDFKEDPARSQKPGGNPEARRTEMLLDAAICFANADGESFIVLGVRDDQAGPQAFTGTQAMPDKIMREIFNKTTPNLTVEATEEEFQGTRLIVVRVPQGLSVYSRRNGAATRRNRKSCIPLSEDERRTLQFQRLNPDHSKLPSPLTLPNLSPLALSTGIQLFNTRHPDDSVQTPEALLRRLGLVTSDGILLKAAEILFGPPQPGRIMAQHLWRTAPGQEPERNDVNSPLVLAIQEMRERVHTHSNTEMERVELPTGQERQIQDFPASAVDEVVLNAFAHRDWELSQPIIVDQSPHILSVQSPGGLPVGVDPQRLLTTPSTPRNPTLMQALHHLGLVEQTSRGFDRMWTSMLSSGRPAPEVDANEFRVRVSFTASVVDTSFVRALSLLHTVIDEQLTANVNVLLVLKELTRTSVLTEGTASELLQLSRQECRETLAWLKGIGLLVTSHSSNLWSLAPRVLAMLRTQGVETPAEGDVQGWIIDAVKGGAVTNRQVVAATGAQSTVVTEVLRHLANTGAIRKDPNGPERGSRVRWIAV